MEPPTADGSGLLCDMIALVKAQLQRTRTKRAVQADFQTAKHAQDRLLWKAKAYSPVASSP